MTKKILNQAQAKAVYDAMCALNNVGARVTVKFPTRDGLITVIEGVPGHVYVEETIGTSCVAREAYRAQNDFATAYEVL